jgi:DNA-binding GntR family transcriptional regulator
MMFERKPLRTDVQEEVLDRLITGRLAPGERINESRLSADLGISRTPLREAMIGLQQRGFLVGAMGRGFLVPPLSRRGIGEVLAVLALLEPEAIRLAGRPAAAVQVELGNVISRARLEPSEATRTAHRFYEFHRFLLQSCPNVQLRIIGDHLNHHTLRYLRSALAAGMDASPAWDALADLLELLRRGDIDAACGRIPRYRQDQTDAILATLPENP